MLLDNSYKQLKEIFRENMDINLSSRVLDIGCGRRGNFLGINSVSYLGIDIDSAIISELEKSNTGNYQCKNIKKMELKPESFDFIISTSFLHHLSDVECREILEKFKAAVKPAGIIIIADGVYPRSIRNVFGYLLRYLDRGRYVRTHQQYKDIFTSDFLVDKSYYFETLIFPYSVYVLRKK